MKLFKLLLLTVTATASASTVEHVPVNTDELLSLESAYMDLVPSTVDPLVVRKDSDEAMIASKLTKDEIRMDGEGIIYFGALLNKVIEEEETDTQKYVKVDRVNIRVIDTVLNVPVDYFKNSSGLAANYRFAINARQSELVIDDFSPDTVFDSMKYIRVVRNNLSMDSFKPNPWRAGHLVNFGQRFMVQKEES